MPYLSRGRRTSIRARGSSPAPNVQWCAVASRSTGVGGSCIWVGVSRGSSISVGGRSGLIRFAWRRLRSYLRAGWWDWRRHFSRTGAGVDPSGRRAQVGPSFSLEGAGRTRTFGPEDAGQAHSFSSEGAWHGSISQGRRPSGRMHQGGRDARPDLWTGTGKLQPERPSVRP